MPFMPPSGAAPPPPPGQAPPSGAAPPPTGPSEPRGTLVPPTGGPAGAAPPMAEQQGDVDPKQVDQFLEKCWQVIYGGDTPEGQMSSPVLGMLRGGPEGGQASDPVQALADTAATIAARVVSSAVEQQHQLDGAAVFVSMLELIGELATDAGTEGIYDYSQEEIDGAAARAGETLYAQTQESGLWAAGRNVCRYGGHDTGFGVWGDGERDGSHGAGRRSPAGSHAVWWRSGRTAAGKDDMTRRGWRSLTKAELQIVDEFKRSMKEEVIPQIVKVIEERNSQRSYDASS